MCVCYNANSNPVKMHILYRVCANALRIGSRDDEEEEEERHSSYPVWMYVCVWVEWDGGRCVVQETMG